MNLNTESDNYSRSDEEEHREIIKQRFHVLAVDDSHIDRKLLERLLTVSSYQVTCVDSGDKALEYLGLIDNIEGENEYDTSLLTSCASSSSQQDRVSKVVNLIMTDYSMPGISGYDLLKRVKDSNWKDIPVVVMSSENVPSRINMCLEGGAEEFLLKPLKLSDLAKLHSHLLTLSNSNSSNCHGTAINGDNSIYKNDNNCSINCNEIKPPGVKELLPVNFLNFTMF